MAHVMSFCTPLECNKIFALWLSLSQFPNHAYLHGNTKGKRKKGALKREGQEETSAVVEQCNKYAPIHIKLMVCQGDYMSNTTIESTMQATQEYSTDKKDDWYYFIQIFEEEQFHKGPLMTYRIDRNGEISELVWIQKGHCINGTDMLKLFLVFADFFQCQVIYLMDVSQVMLSPIHWQSFHSNFSTPSLLPNLEPSTSSSSSQSLHVSSVSLSNSQLQSHYQQSQHHNHHHYQQQQQQQQAQHSTSHYHHPHHHHHHPPHPHPHHHPPHHHHSHHQYSFNDKSMSTRYSSSCDTMECDPPNVPSSSSSSSTLHLSHSRHTNSTHKCSFHSTFQNKKKSSHSSKKAYLRLIHALASKDGK
ncbi:hypothetical protein RFI_10657, partial [Reticulomyxa filosa]